jgi:hypothetical protein
MKGGKQPGAGRPPSDNPARHIVKARLTDEQYAKWLEMGGSRWVKRLINEELGKTPIHNRNKCL